MKRWKLGLAFLVSVVLICITGTQAYAQTRASDYIKGYSVSAQQGDYRGQVYIQCDIRANWAVPRIGVKEIQIFQSDGSHVTTIQGTMSNGLIAPKSSIAHIVTYTYKGTPGMSYYAKVTLCAGSASDYDTRLVRTQTVQAPK